MSVEVQLIQQAYKFALAPTPPQEEKLRSHVGAARFSYNWGVEQMTAALDARQAEKASQAGEAVTDYPSHFDLCKMWTAYKDAHAADPEPAEGERKTNTAWVAENFVGTYQAALRDAHKAWADYFKSRAGKRRGRMLGRPRYKKRGRCRDSFQVHGATLRLLSADGPDLRTRKAAVNPGSTRYMAVLPKIGPVFLAESARKLRRRLDKGGVPCPQCRQAGVVPAPADTKSKKARSCTPCRGVNCLRCDGTGKIRECPACAGTLQCPAARIVRGTVSRDSDGRWHISLTAEIAREVRARTVRKQRPDGKIARVPVLEPSKRQRAGGVIGVDFGVRDIVTLSDGQAIPNPRFLQKVLGKLATAQRAASRCAPGSAGLEKANARVAKLHARVKHQRLDALHKATTTLVHGYAVIAVEGWDVQETVRYRRRGKVDPSKAPRGGGTAPAHIRRSRNRAVADTGIGMGRWQLSSKGKWYGCNVLVMDKHAPTGRTCSACGTVRDKPVPPADEMFTCQACGATMPRRVNTARALELRARKSVDLAPSTGERLNARGGGVSPDTARPLTARRIRPSPLKREAARLAARPGEDGSPAG